MSFFRILADKIHSLNRFSLLAVQLGTGIMVCVYITALFARMIAPHVSYYINAMHVFYSATEVAPVCFVAGIAAAIIIDIAYRSYFPNDKNNKDL